MKRRSWVWLVVAAVMIGVAAWLMSANDPEREEPVWERVNIPRRMTQQEKQRSEQRRTLVATPTPDAPQAPQRPRDPLVAAMPSTVERGAVVVEANAIRYSPVGELLIDCLTSRDDGRGLAQFKERTGIDPLEDLDRVAMMDETVVLSGHFDKAQWEALFPEGGTPLGRSGTLYQGPARANGTRPSPVGVWNNQMVIVGDTEDEVRAVIDRLEGRGLQGPPVFDESMTFGEIYGVLSPEGVASILEEQDPALADQVRKLADRVELHVDARSDVGVVAKISGPNPEDTRDLGKTLGAALALGRTKAQLDGEEDLAELMDLARVVPGTGDFQVELGLPLPFLEKHLKECVRKNRERSAARMDGGVQL